MPMATSPTRTGTHCRRIGEAVGDHARASNLRLDMERALAVLTEGERAAIVQCYHNDLSHEEAAYVLDCPVGTIKTHILRGKAKLKARLAAWAPAVRGDQPGSDEATR